MKLMACGVIGLVLVVSLAATGAGVRQSRSADAADTAGKGEFRAFLREFEEGTNRFINGDATLWNEHVSYAADATIMGGFGALFRKESGAWKLVHRHEDPLVTKTPPGAVIQK
jgi:hypothetical protein